MGKHTEGPWRIGRKDDDGYGSNILIDAPSNNTAFTACALYIGPGRYAEQLANAKLIAAAPDTLAERDRLKAVNAGLVEALEGAVEHLEWSTLQGQNAYANVLGALAKAKGEGK